MRHRPRPLHRTVGVVAFPPPFYIPAATTAHEPRRTADGDGTTHQATRSRGSRTSRFRLVLRPRMPSFLPRAASAGGCPRPNTGKRGARAADGHVLVQWCWRRPAAPAWCAFGSGQESSVMGSWRAGRIQRNVGQQAERLLFHFGRDCGSCRDLLLLEAP